MKALTIIAIEQKVPILVLLYKKPRSKIYTWKPLMIMISISSIRCIKEGRSIRTSILSAMDSNKKITQAGSLNLLMTGLRM
jgi:hypothetical protein